jgi:integrase
MRHGELMGLMWEDFDLENATVTVNRTLVELRSR